MRVLLALRASAAIVLVACGDDSGARSDAGSPGDGDANRDASGSAFELPTPNAAFDYQLGGAYPPPAGVAIVARDRTAPTAAGVYNICYVNGFQIQPDEETFWTTQHPELILRDAGGNPIIDAEWDEMLLDVGTPEKRAELLAIEDGWIAGCDSAGYLAVEIDNLDSFSRSQGKLTEAHAVAFMRGLADAAHARGLAIAQKNSAELVGRKAELGTDFVVAEECNRYTECDDYRAGYGDHVFVIEYRRQDFDAGCTAHPGLSIVLRDLDLVAPGNPAYAFEGC